MSYLIYGAYGYTGQLIARMAAERGQKPLLAGRDADRLVALAESLGLDYAVCALDDSTTLDAILHDKTVVLHCAGPFSRTAAPMAEACLRTKTHYLDVTGEISVYAHLATLDERARAASIMILPGVGFDVVPSDCLALYLKQQLPTATHLDLAIMGLGSLSHGTATTAVENIAEGGAIRRDGILERVPAAWKTRLADFGQGPVEVVSIPWGDVFTAYHSTAIPNITVYAALGKSLPQLMRVTRYFGWLLGSSPVQAFLKKRIDQQPAGPTDDARARGKSFVWGTAWDDEGHRVTARIRGPEGYTYTALAALAIVNKVLGGDAPVGFQTPSQAYGSDLALEVGGVIREDIDG